MKNNLNVDGVCICNSGFSGDDCSTDLSQGLIIQSSSQDICSLFYESCSSNVLYVTGLSIDDSISLEYYKTAAVCNISIEFNSLFNQTSY